MSSQNASGPTEWSADELIPFGKYILLDRVSSGATAAVYRANVRGEAGFERLVAIKRILPHMAGDRDFVETFVREAKTVAKLAHEGICPIYELGRVGESLYMAIEYIQGRDLGRITRRLEQRGETMPPLIAAWIAARLCDALDYAHTLKNARGSLTGVIHRDISPANIMLSYEGQVRLLDFGLAKAVGRAQSTNVDALKFKIGYMSPEMVKGRPLDARSDLFSVAVCLYEMVTGRRLFAGQNDIETIGLVSKASVPPPSAVMEDPPEDLEELMLHALAREPNERYQTAAEMSEALNAYIHRVDPTFGPPRLAEFLHKLFAEDIVQEQQSIKRLLAASNDPEVIKARRAYFTSVTGVAARARAEIERQLAKERASQRPAASGRVVVPKPAPLPKPAAAAGEEAFEDEPTAYYDPDKTHAGPPSGADVAGEAGFDDEPTQYLGNAEFDAIQVAELPDTGGFEDEPTEIFFNKEDGEGMQALLEELNAPEAPRGALNRPIIAPEFAEPTALPPRVEPAGARSSMPPTEPAPAPPSIPTAAPLAPPSQLRWAVFGLAVVLLLVCGVLAIATPLGVTLGLRAAPTGAIELRTIPPVAAEVMLDGVFRGIAPLRIQGVRVGLRKLRLHAPGYAVVTKQVGITDGSTVVLDLALEAERPVVPPTPPAAEATAAPQPAPVSVPAAPSSTAEAPTPEPPRGAPQTAAAAHPHSHDTHHELAHSPAVDEPATATPAPAAPTAVAPNTPGTLSINTVPWAYVYIDGRDTGRNTPLLGYPLTPGPHAIRLQTATGAMHDERVNVQPGQTVRLSHRF